MQFYIDVEPPTLARGAEVENELVTTRNRSRMPERGFRVMW
jgi:hypothetical protein